jgi:hypothetical protein
MRKYFPAMLAAVAMLLVTPPTVFAQEEAEPEPVFHYVTVTTWDFPGGEQGQKAMDWVEKVQMPLTRMNPNVLSSRFARHIWGSNSAQAVQIVEYADWAAINADCEPCDAWFEEQQPEEGTPEREEWDAMAQAFFQGYLGHHDEIYLADMDYAK